MNQLRYLQSGDISNYFTICEIIAHDSSFRDLGDLMRILYTSDKPRAASDPDLKAAMYTMIHTLMEYMKFKVYTSERPKPRRLRTMEEVELYLEDHWDRTSLANRKQLLYFMR